LAGCAVALALLVAALHRLGGAALAAPPLLHPGQLGRWAAARDPATMAFALVRLVALVAGWYVLVVCVAHLAAAGSRSQPLARVADLVTLPLLRRAMTAVAGATLVASALAVAPASAAPTPPAQGHGQQPRPAAGAVGTPQAEQRRITAGDSGTAALRRLPAVDEEPTTPSRPAAPTTTPPTTIEPSAPNATTAPAPNPPTTSRPPATAGSAPETTAAPAPPDLGTASLRRTSPPRGPRPKGSPADAPGDPEERAAPTTAPPLWTTRPGDSLWSIAQHVLEWTRGHAPSDGEVATYLPKLVAANAGRLARPGHPELIFPGQEFELPPID
jgi:hypothetical protein